MAFPLLKYSIEVPTYVKILPPFTLLVGLGVRAREQPRISPKARKNTPLMDTLVDGRYNWLLNPRGVRI